MRNIQVGDIVTAYRDGYHEVVKIEKRWKNKTKSSEYEKAAYCIIGDYDPSTCGDEMNSLIYYKKKYKLDGTPVKSKKVYTCDSFYCKPMYESIQEQIKRHEASLEKLKQILCKNIS